MRKTIVTLSALLMALTAHISHASCSLKQTACDTGCKVRYINDTFGKMGCMTQCAAERTVCSTKKGVETATEKTKKLLEN